MMHSVVHWCALGLLLTTVGTLRTVLSKDVWHRPGCHKVGHTRTIQIPDCVQFTISTNACRGFCESFAVPSAPVADGDPGNNAGLMANIAPLVGGNHMGGGGHANGGGAALHHPHHHGSSSSSGIINPMLQGAEFPHVQRRRAPTNKPVTSVGQCCNIMQSEDVQVQVNCVDGPRNLTFKSATKCSCYHCKKD